ncbi:MAG TPA: biotin--[acetyl-CoA-carboxylase] ligase [Candidatus Binataceae bacterium]|nr:biotin--[acetyl-CoA-carboxylase] ligase [Candidatus Binataceae bacterium]
MLGRMSNPYQSIARGEPGTIGWRIHYFEELSSTQDLASQLAEQGAEQGIAVIAETQSAGHGRLGRQWYSPPGLNLYVTIILRPRPALSALGSLNLMAGVAAAEAIESVAPGIVALKWPNDVWLRRKKTGGILAKALSDGSQISCVLLGMGLNLNLRSKDIPDDLQRIATSVQIETGVECDRSAVAAVLFSRLDTRYTEMQKHGFASIRPLWERYSALAGKEVTVTDHGKPLSGVVKGIDDEGALILETKAGTARVLSGDVSVVGAYD